MLDVEFVGAATLRNLTSANRYQRVHRALADWVHIYQNELPVMYSVDLWPELRGMKVDITLEVGHDFELPDGERVLLAGLTRLLRPRVIFEFGTFTGTTTKLLSDFAPDAIVHTIDLPDDGFTVGSLDRAARWRSVSQRRKVREAHRPASGQHETI
jgi:hypothetical protein